MIRDCRAGPLVRAGPEGGRGDGRRTSRLRLWREPGRDPRSPTLATLADLTSSHATPVAGKTQLRHDQVDAVTDQPEAHHQRSHDDRLVLVTIDPFPHLPEPG